MYYYLISDDSNLIPTSRDKILAERFSTQDELDNELKLNSVNRDYRNEFYGFYKLPLYNLGSKLIPNQLYCTYKYGCDHFCVLASDDPGEYYDLNRYYLIEMDETTSDKMYLKNICENIMDKIRLKYWDTSNDKIAWRKIKSTSI